MLRTWHTDLRVGVPEVDGDHKRICDALDALYDSIVRGPRPSELFVPLQDIVDIMTAHFCREELMMHDIGYEGAELHLKNHFEALRILSSMVFNCETNNIMIAGDTLALIKVWTIEHIMTYDKPFTAAINGASNSSKFIEVCTNAGLCRGPSQ